MKLSKETLTILKNFKSINIGIIFRPGNVIRTISSGTTILAEAQIAENFPRKFAIADLGKFISVQELFEDSPDIEFHENNLTISRDNTELTYVYASEEVVKSFDGELQFPESAIKFDVSSAELKKLINAAGALSAPHFVVRVRKNKVVVSVEDYRNSSASKFSLSLANAEKTQSAEIFIKIENLSILEGDYTIEFMKKGGKCLSAFSNKTTPVKYFISVETESKIEE